MLKDTPLLLVYHNKELSKNFAEGLRAAIEIGRGQDIPTSYYYGFRQLMEIAIKALSPGINDPGTATIALQALSDLLSNTRKLLPENTFYDKNGTTRIVSKEKTFDDLFSEHVLPIWDYGKNDRLIQKEMLHILGMLSLNGVDNEIGKLIRDVKTSR